MSERTDNLRGAGMVQLVALGGLTLTYLPSAPSDFWWYAVIGVAAFCFWGAYFCMSYRPEV